MLTPSQARQKDNLISTKEKLIKIAANVEQRRQATITQLEVVEGNLKISQTKICVEQWKAKELLKQPKADLQEIEMNYQEWYAKHNEKTHAPLLKLQADLMKEQQEVRVGGPDRLCCPCLSISNELFLLLHTYLAGGRRVERRAVSDGSQ